MKREFKLRAMSKRAQVTGILFWLLISVALFLWFKASWITTVVLMAYPVFSIYQHRRRKYVLEENGDLKIIHASLFCRKTILNVKDIEAIEYTQNPGRKAPLMFECKAGFHFLNPAEPEELIKQVKQIKPTIKVEVN